MNTIPTKENNPKGLHQRYSVKKNQGQTDPNAEYFVLRLDNGGSDQNHINACRIGVNAYADAIEPFIPELARDLKKRYPVAASLPPQEVEKEEKITAEQYLKSKGLKNPYLDSGIMGAMVYAEDPRIRASNAMEDYAKLKSSPSNTEEGEKQNEALKTIQQKLMDMIAYDRIPDAACPDINDLIDIAHKALKE